MCQRILYWLIALVVVGYSLSARFETSNIQFVAVICTYTFIYDCDFLLPGHKIWLLLIVSYQQSYKSDITIYINKEQKHCGLLDFGGELVYTYILVLCSMYFSALTLQTPVL